MPDRGRRMLGLLLVVWIGFVLVMFYAVKQQKPITPEDLPALAQFSAAFVTPPSATGLVDSVLNISVVGLLCMAAALLGFRLSPLPYPYADRSCAARAEFWLMNIGLGLGAMSLVTFVLGLLGWLTFAVVALLLVALLVIAPMRTLSLLAQDLLRWRTIAMPRALTAFLLVSLSLALLVALTPPAAWDALAYHLAVPRRALDAGRLIPNGDIIPHENFPMLMSSLYMLAMFVRGDIAAQLLHFVFGLLTLGVLAVVARQCYSRAAVPFALALTLSMPMFLTLSTWAYNDVALAFYTLAAVYAYRRWEVSSDTRYLTLCALMAGCTMGLKYTSFVLPLGVVALMLVRARRRGVRPIARFSLVALLVAAPWYVKNLAFTGNPFYPFIFGGEQWDTLRAAWYARSGSGIGLDPVALLTLPLFVTLGTRDANFFDGRIGPLALICVPLLWLNRPQRDVFVILFCLYFGVWIVGVMGSLALWQSRLLLPALVLLMSPLAQALVNLSRLDLPTVSLKRIATMVVALVLSLNLLNQVVQFAITNPLAFVAGAESREQFLARQIPNEHVSAMAAVNRLPMNARVQFLWEPRSYLALRSVRADTLLDALPHLVATTSSLDAAVRQLKSDGFTHILVYERGAQFAFDETGDFFTARGAEDLRQLENDYARVVYENDAYRLFEIK